MGRRTRIRIVGKRAQFDAEKWARAVEALARQLHRESGERGGYPTPSETEDGLEPRSAC